MSKASAEELYRLYNEENLSQREIGERFHLVQKLDRIILLPVSGEPLKALRDEMSDIDKSVDQLKQEALDPEARN